MKIPVLTSDAIVPAIEVLIFESAPNNLSLPKVSVSTKLSGRPIPKIL